jgi:hypothetical protein
LAGWPVAQAQIDLAGAWTNWIDQDQKLRGAGPDPGTYLGVPLNAAARAAALSYTPDTVGELDRQCAPWTVNYIMSGPMSLAFWPTKRIDGSVLAWNIGGSIDRYAMTIWMDGRSPPGPQAPHTLGGYSTGRWMGDTLATTTTHIQDGYLTRNGAPNSDQEVFTMFITRHDNFLTITGIVHDPVYLTEPFVTNDVFTIDPKVTPFNSVDQDATCTPEEEETSTTSYRVPSYLGASPTQDYATKNYGIPPEAAHGNAASMYPEYTDKLKGQYQRPQAYCTLDCCGAQPNAQNQGDINFNVNLLKCRQDNP